MSVSAELIRVFQLAITARSFAAVPEFQGLSAKW